MSNGICDKLIAPLIEDEDAKEQAQQERQSVVAPAQRSDSALHKVKRKQTLSALPVQSFQSILSDARHSGEKPLPAPGKISQCF